MFFCDLHIFFWFSCKIVQTKDLRRVCLYEFELKSNATKATKNIDLAFNDSVANKNMLRFCIANFRSGDISLENEVCRKPLSIVYMKD